MLRVFVLQRLAKFLMILSWVIMGSLALQGAALSFHQGKHLAQTFQESNRDALEEGTCAECVAFHQFSEMPSLAIALTSFSPLVSILISFEPVGPKTNILRTCDARGPPSLV